MSVKYEVRSHLYRGEEYYDVFEVVDGKDTARIEGPFESRSTAQKLAKLLRDAKNAELGVTTPLTPMGALKARITELEARIAELEANQKSDSDDIIEDGDYRGPRK